MQLESLKVFCDVVRQRSFSSGARLNHLTQSAASQIVSQIERRLGVELIDRSTRPLQPTPQGRLYFEGCAHIVEKYAELEASVCKEPCELNATVHVAAIYSVGLGDMGKLVERFRKHHPHAHIKIDYCHPRQVYERVLDGTADFGLVSFPKARASCTRFPGARKRWSWPARRGIALPAALPCRSTSWKENTTSASTRSW